MPDEVNNRNDPARCRRCGRCCTEKLVVDDEVVMVPAVCKYLDVETMLCTQFDRRFDLDVHCLTVEEGLAAQAFPADCPYVVDRDDYVPPREDWWTVPEIVDLVESGRLNEVLDRAARLVDLVRRGRRPSDPKEDQRD